MLILLKNLPGMMIGENVATETARLREECSQLYGENAALRSTVLALHSEVYGARYDSMII